MKCLLACSLRCFFFFSFQILICICQTIPDKEGKRCLFWLKTPGRTYEMSAPDQKLRVEWIQGESSQTISVFPDVNVWSVFGSVCPVLL